MFGVLIGIRYLFFFFLLYIGKFDGVGDIIIDMVGIIWWFNGKKIVLLLGFYV